MVGMTGEPQPSSHSQRGLDWLTFFVADVQTSFGPFIAVYLTANGWGQGAIGSLLTVNNVVGLATAVPAGALVDRTRHKRRLVAACLIMIAAGSLLIACFPAFPPVLAAEILHGLSGSALNTALVAIGLGLVGHRAFHTRIGRNQRFSAFGTALTAGAMGVLGTLLSPGAPFFATAVLCLPALFALSQIRSADIGYERARSSEGRREPHSARWTELLRNQRLVVLAICLFLFQFADSSMLPLASERLAADQAARSEIVTAALVIVPQLVTGLVAGLIARQADARGRKHLLIIGFAALPLRAGLFAMTSKASYLIAVQALGGLTAPIIGIMVPLVVGDVVRRSGRYNVALGTVNMVGALGAAASTTLVGFVAQRFGFAVAFGSLATAGLAGLVLLVALLPETDYESKRDD